MCLVKKKSQSVAKVQKTEHDLCCARHYPRFVYTCCFISLSHSESVQLNQSLSTVEKYRFLQ